MIESGVNAQRRKYQVLKFMQLRLISLNFPFLPP